MTSPEPTPPNSANAWFHPEHHVDSSQPAEIDIAETNPLDPTAPDALHRLLQALRNMYEGPPMPPHPHELPSHDPAPNADCAVTTSAASYRACLANINPNDVLRSIRFCNGSRNWSLTPYEIYQLARCRLRLSEHHQRAPELVLDGPDPDEIRNTLARLGFEPHDIVINELQPAEDCPCEPRPAHPADACEQAGVGAEDPHRGGRMRVILARARTTTTGSAPPAVHAYRVPHEPTSVPVWKAVCGDEIAPHEAEQVPRFTGAPCSICLLATIGDQPSHERTRDVSTYPALQPISPTGRWAVGLWGERTIHRVATNAPRAQLDGHDVIHALCGHLGWGPLDKPPAGYPICRECHHTHEY